MNLSRIKRPTTSCGKPVIKLVTTTECKDNIADNYYGTGTIIDGSGSVSAFPFQKVTNLRGWIKDTPREITRQDSLNCRTQKVFSKVSYQLQGGDYYPTWKMRELEEQFHAKQMIWDGLEMKFPSQTPFEEIGTFCNPVYRLRAAIDECRKQQIYGCQSECEPNCYHFLIPANIITQNFFNEAGQQVASTYTQLLDWYRQQSNISEVTDINADIQIQCDYYRIFKVVGTGYVPSFLFFDTPTQSNKIFGKALDCNSPNYAALCGNVDNRSCGQIQINPVVIYELTCEVVEITGVEVFILGESCDVVPFPDWVQHTGDTDIISAGNVRTLSVSVFNDNYIGSGETDGSVNQTTPIDEVTCIIDTGVPPNGDVYEVQFDGVPISPSEYSYNPSTQEMTFSPCVGVDVEITVKYTIAGTSPTFNNEIIAVITGSSCLPPTTLYLSNANNASIPLGSTLVIDTMGNVKWIGAPTSSDMTGTVIEVIDIIYNV